MLQHRKCFDTLTTTGLGFDEGNSKTYVLSTFEIVEVSVKEFEAVEVVEEGGRVLRKLAEPTLEFVHIL